jgi:putative alpha-1,2-mannosidase
MSAWYVFSALGFYPVDPVSEDYQLGTPLFKKAVINLDNGKKFTINVFKNTPSAIYIRSVNLNGASHKLNTISYKAIAKGGLMNIYLTEKHK